MTKAELMQIISEALEDDNVTEESSMDNTEAWDSLGHLSILTSIDAHLQGSAASITGLASASSVSEIAQLLEEHLLIEKQ